MVTGGKEKPAPWRGGLNAGCSTTGVCLVYHQVHSLANTTDHVATAATGIGLPALIILVSAHAHGHQVMANHAKYRGDRPGYLYHRRRLLWHQAVWYSLMQ